MIDFHNHVLPGADDGAKDMAMAISMLKTASSQGITDVVNTIHFQHPKMEGKNVDYLYIQSEINKLQEEIDKESIAIKIHMGAEVFYLPNLVEISENPLTTIGNGKYMLIEFPTHILPPGFEDEFYRLQLKGITPIIAHPERYRAIQNDSTIVDSWIERGYVIQVDAGSLLGQFGKVYLQTAESLMKSSSIHLIGSDAHNDSKRNFCLGNLFERLITEQSIDYVKILQNNTKLLLDGKRLKIIALDGNTINNKNIFQHISDYFYSKIRINK